MDATSPILYSTNHPFTDIIMQDIDNTPQHGDEDAASETATIINEREPFEAFQPKVVSIAHQKLHHDTSEVAIEQMRGGSFNRVSGDTISPKPKKFNFDWFKSHCLGARR
jgi:hypothetical protein